MNFKIYHLLDVADPIAFRDRLMGLQGKRVFFDLDRIICEDQVHVAINRAMRAYNAGRMIASNWGIEVLLHLAGTHQIKDAIELVAINEHTSRVGIVQDEELEAEPDWIPGLPELAPSPELINKYGIGKEDPCLDIISKGVRIIVDHE